VRALRPLLIASAARGSMAPGGLLGVNWGLVPVPAGGLMGLCWEPLDSPVLGNLGETGDRCMMGSRLNR
jgi:hypothetical protein